MKKFILGCLLVSLCGSQSASAAVVLNEIAWMGSTSSSADEWIELYNGGSTTQDLTGWKITGKGGATIVLLSGSVPADGYFLIERSDDNAVPGVTADLVVSFGKGISNDGETLKLIDGGGNTIDTAVGGKNWSKLGGDKVSKQTAQRTSSGWITAVPTPRALNKTASLASEVAPPLQKIAPSPIAKSSRSATTPEGKTAAKNTQLRIVSAETEVVPKEQLISTTSVAANVLWQRSSDKEAEKRAWTWMIVALLLVIGASVIIMRASIYEPTEADKYAIIEDIIEENDEEDRLSDF